MFGCFKRVGWGSLAAALSLSSAASALVLQPTPGGVPVPTLQANVTTCTDKNVEVCLDQAEGDPTLIDAQADALVAPETFQPTCQLTFTPIVKGGSIYDVFGWYNVKPNPADPTKFLKPTQAELYGMFVAHDFQTGAQLAGQSVVLDLAVESAAGRYKGGQIGFFVVSTSDVLSIDPTTHKVIGTIRFQFHTQHLLNTGSTAAKTFYNVLTWESIAKANTFYFGWEDLPTDMGSDNDFDDFVFSVTGVQCGGGGQPCETGLQGVCAAGVQQCKKSVITCVQNIQPAVETCNALDDDCNGQVDDGDLCDAGKVCHRGVCVPKCGTGEFRCPATAVCSEGGLCVEQACVGKDCPLGQICSAGDCVDSCSGIACPSGRACRNGGCVDPCVGIECDKGFACVLGICTSCECSACGAGLVCHDSQCVDSGCETQSCAAGSHCELGACKDNCDGATCPEGQVCTAGECVADPNAVSSGGAGQAGGGIVIGPLGGSSSTGSGGVTSTGGRGSNRLIPSKPACSCEVPGGRASDNGGLLLLALVGLSLRRRKAA